MDKNIDGFHKMAMNLFLSLTMHEMLKYKFEKDEKVLEDWMVDTLCTSAEFIFPIPAEA